METASTASSDNAGFLTVVRREDGCHVGGYLVLNTLGRPLEFHCTEPVRPNRAQEILYGTTLLPYLYGEQIATILLAQATQPVQIAFTDQAAVLAARPLQQTPLVHLVRSAAPAVAGDDVSIIPSIMGRIGEPPTPPAEKPVHRTTLRLNTPDGVALYQAAVHTRFPQDLESLSRWIATVDGMYDLIEPIERIWRAIDQLRQAA